MASDDDSKKVRSEIIFTIIAGMIGLVALIGLIYVLCLLRHRYNQHLLRQAQQQQGTTTTRPYPRVKPRLSSHRQHLASSRRQQQQPPQPDDTYSIDSASTMIELQQRFHNSVNSNSSYMADLFSITSDMLMQQSSPTSSTLSPPPPQQPVSKFSGMDPMAHHHQQLPKRLPPHPSSEAYFATNFANLPTSASSKIILNHQNDNSTAGDDNDDDFDEVWSYVAVRVVVLCTRLVSHKINPVLQNSHFTSCFQKYLNLDRR